MKRRRIRGPNGYKALLKIVQARAQAFYDSGGKVQVDTRYGTVRMFWPGYTSDADWDNKCAEVFLQGDEGDAFLEEAKNLWEKAWRAPLPDAYACVAYDYIPDTLVKKEEE